MTTWPKTVCTVDRLLGLFYGLITELYDCPAAQADEVIMMLMAVGMLIAPSILVGTGLTGQTSVGEELDRSKNGRLADSRIDLACGGKELIGGNMVLNTKKGIEHGLSRAS